jgi:hypothetical protein
MNKYDLMISVYSFYTQQPASEYIELLEDSTLLSMTDSIALADKSDLEFPNATRMTEQISESAIIPMVGGHLITRWLM